MFFSAAPVLAVLLSAASGDPTPPSGGFRIRSDEDIPVTWCDGYNSVISVYWPDHTAPTGGWPSILCVHGGQGSRNSPNIQQRMTQFVRHGYVCFAYDTRGKGDTPALNPGVDYETDFEVEMRDAAEAFDIAEAVLGAGMMDRNRLAMSGISGGGRHSYRGVALSGSPLSNPCGSVTHFPVLQAIAVNACPVSVLGDLMGDTVNTVKTESAVGFYGFDATDDRRIYLLAEDWPRLASTLHDIPLWDYFPLIQGTTMPILHQIGFEDAKHQVKTIAESFIALGTNGPRSFSVGTVEHGSPKNEVEEAFLYESMRRWFDVHLKGLPPASTAYGDAALPPADTVEYLDLSSHWAHREHSQWPPQDVTLQTLYLRGDGTLSITPPSAGEPDPTLNHFIDPSYTLELFLQDGGGPGVVLGPGKIEHHRLDWDSVVLGQDMELVGRPRFLCEIDVTAAEFQIQATLFCRLPGQAERYVTSGYTTVRDSAPGLHDVMVELDDIAMLIPAGARLRLALENITLYQDPDNIEIDVLPTFTSADLTITIDPVKAARLELPVADRDVFVTPRYTTIHESLSQDHVLTVDAGAARGGQPFFLHTHVRGRGGQGFQSLGSQFQFHLLDGSGRATVTIPAASLGGDLVGSTITYTAEGFIGGGWQSQPAELVIWP